MLREEANATSNSAQYGSRCGVLLRHDLLLEEAMIDLNRLLPEGPDQFFDRESG
jgi:hypothetical protein